MLTSPSGEGRGALRMKRSSQWRQPDAKRERDYERSASFPPRVLDDGLLVLREVHGFRSTRSYAIDLGALGCGTPVSLLRSVGSTRLVVLAVSVVLCFCILLFGTVPEAWAMLGQFLTFPTIQPLGR
jgi:hypothetical protein